ncbi:UNKNOWN [Stylonychia lemnae]|uniref:Uncharacterized protein n=1 Tax=Stylonychia lemnae TaxID=5949 RepID=A0A077ZNE9_STYLE|nr:UNKNOWN [Stylonychia lemnae]|eukprot:CDW71502.1 UNKNOWN [Stylonychia lemnae]
MNQNLQRLLLIQKNISCHQPSSFIKIQKYNFARNIKKPPSSDQLSSSDASDAETAKIERPKSTYKDWQKELKNPANKLYFDDIDRKKAHYTKDIDEQEYQEKKEQLEKERILVNKARKELKERDRMPQWKQEFMHNQKPIQDIIGESEGEFAKLAKLKDFQQFTTLDFLNSIKNKSVLESDNLLSKIMIAFIKKLYQNEGIDIDNDDIFRPRYKEQREKIKRVFTGRSEIKIAIQTLSESIQQVPVNVLASIITIYSKGNIEVSAQMMKSIIKRVKILLLDDSSSQNIMSFVVLFRMLFKLSVHGNKEEVRQILLDSMEFFFQFLQMNHQNMNMEQIAQSARALTLENQNSQIYKQPILSIIQDKLVEVPKMSNILMYDLIETLMQVNQTELSSLDQKSLVCFQTLFKEVIERLKAGDFKLHHCDLFIKQLTNKKLILQKEAFYNQDLFFKLIFIVFIQKANEMDFSNFMLYIKAMERYNIEVSSDVAALINLRLEQLTDKMLQLQLDKDGTSRFDLYRFFQSVSKLTKSNHITTKLYSKFLQNYLSLLKSQFLNESKEDIKLNILKTVTLILTQTKALEIKVDAEILSDYKSFRRQGNLELQRNDQ